MSRRDVSSMPDPEVTRNGLESVTSSDPSAAALRPGVVFADRYRIETLIGLGGMGAVYKAFDLELNLTVALKTIRSDASASSGAESLARRFKQELLLAREVSHPNILRIHDLGNAGGLKYITMAFVEGVDLAGLLLASSRLPTERVVSIGRQIAAGLAAAHDV